MKEYKWRLRLELLRTKRAVETRRTLPNGSVSVSISIDDTHRVGSWFDPKAHNQKDIFDELWERIFVNIARAHLIGKSPFNISITKDGTTIKTLAQ